jgi:hypothetical protein
MSNIFLSGLPRSGHTILSNVLKQNPALSDIELNKEWGTDSSIFDLIKLGNPKIIVTHRPILEILASFIKLAEEYPTTNYIDKLMIEENFPPLGFRPLNDARCDWLMRPYGGIDNQGSLFKNMAIHKEWFHLVKYDDFASNPEHTLKEIYKFLELEHFQHDLENIISLSDEKEDKEVYGIPTMHKTKPTIQKSDTDYTKVLSNYVIQKYGNYLDFTEDWLGFRL